MKGRVLRRVSCNFNYINSEKDSSSNNEEICKIINLISHLINKIIINETSIESWRLKLHKIKTFNIKNIFENIQSGNGSIIIDSLRKYLSNFDINSTQSDFLFNRLDKMGNKKIEYKQVKLRILLNINI